ncbi:hypothetical protein GCM10011519_10220 [Marmoricola endophyticus]|uniref:Uncharacterized protein n=1 Tax=Marmoricola endophyticus TaxID=2040280 RepID=A0A917BE49_9ACTN|nr:phospholipase [Marmoricola endophyticus]GGF38591.1 hypothetical protein GCM10011519_10220 [Marmoricola endophyticus]
MSEGHGHGHGHGGAENPFAGQGAVMLDIGGDVGALVVVMPSSMIGEEIDVADPGDPPGTPRNHVAVVERPIEGEVVPSLVFPELTEGVWTLMPKGTDDVHLQVEVRGGEVTSADWPA